tara:strand:+ start:616 stop:744 length:129 start_codon:yes stop_codon:yes gene_type:complete
MEDNISTKERNLKGIGILEKKLNMSHLTLVKNFIFYSHSLAV